MSEKEQIELLTKENKELKEQLDKVLGEVNELKGLSEENAKLKENVATLKLGLQSLESSFNENKSLKKKLEELQMKSKGIEAVSKRNKELEDELTQLNGQVERMKNLLVNFEDPKDSGNESEVDRNDVDDVLQNSQLNRILDEFDEYEQIIKNIELDQAKMMEENQVCRFLTIFHYKLNSHKNVLLIYLYQVLNV